MALLKAGLVGRFILILLLWLSVAGSGPVGAQTVASAVETPRQLVVGTLVAPPFVMKDANGNWYGLSIDLWLRTAERLGLRYRFQEETLPNLIAKTGTGELDAAIAAITVTAAREKVVDFSQPYYTTGLGVAVPRATEGPLAFLENIFSPGMIEAILGVVGALLLVGLLVWYLERKHNDDFGPHGRGLRSSIMWAAMTAAGDAGDAKPRTFVGQLIWLAWMLASVLLVSSFTAVITSALTTSKLQGRVQQVGDLRNVRTGTVESSAPKRYLEREGIAAATFPTTAAALSALESGKLDAVVFDRPILISLVKDKFPTSLSVLDLTFDRQTYAIALPSNSPLRVSLNQALLEELQAEWWRRDLSKILGDS